MPTYRNANAEVNSLATEIVSRHHPELAEAGVTIQVLMAHAARNKFGTPRGPALKLHGYPVAGIAKINSHEDRVAGKCDATIKLDGDEWDNWDDEEKAAVIDHEALHFELVRTKPKKRKRRGQPPEFIGGGEIVLDDCHRPRLKMRKHDVQIGGFSIIAERYGHAAFEVKAFASLVGPGGQLLFPWTPEAEPKLRVMEAATA